MFLHSSIFEKSFICYKLDRNRLRCGRATLIVSRNIAKSNDATNLSNLHFKLFSLNHDKRRHLLKIDNKSFQCLFQKYIFKKCKKWTKFVHFEKLGWNQPQFGEMERFQPSRLKCRLECNFYFKKQSITFSTWTVFWQTRQFTLLEDFLLKNELNPKWKKFIENNFHSKFW